MAKGLADAAINFCACTNCCEVKPLPCSGAWVSGFTATSAMPPLRQAAKSRAAVKIQGVFMRNPFCGWVELLRQIGFKIGLRRPSEDFAVTILAALLCTINALSTKFQCLLYLSTLLHSAEAAMPPAFQTAYLIVFYCIFRLSTEKGLLQYQYHFIILNLYVLFGISTFLRRIGK